MPASRSNTIASMPNFPFCLRNTIRLVLVQVKALRELVTLPLKHPQLFARYNIRPPRGVLLWGPPGTGKTCLACAAAAEVGVPFFIINGPDVVSQYMGESEAGLQGEFSCPLPAHRLVV